MNPASLYTYVDGVDDLYTRILVDSFGRLSTSIRTAVDDRSPDDDRSPRRRLIDGAIAFRRWAIDNPNEFNLIYTDQIPGYEAPVGGPTVDAELAVGWPFIELIADMLGEDDPGRLVEDDGTDRHVGVYGLRALMHGFASLEANSHAPYTNDRSDLMIMALERFLDDMIERCGSA
ncbi:MAG: TetR-like C-terminal domain-containing protein [Actinomycetota bacterium]